MHYTNPRTAAVIPLYNGAKYIRTALQSVLTQNIKPSQIIVVNDGSTDAGPGIVEEMARQYPIRLLHQENAGQSAARNFGIAQADTELVALLDQDDLWYPNHLEGLVDQFRRTNTLELGWAYSNLDEIDAAGNIVVRSVLRMVPAPHPKRDLFGCIGTDMFVLPSATVLSRRAFEATGGFDERLSGFEDDDLFLRMFRKGYDNVYLDIALSQWRIYDHSASFSPRMARSRMIYFRKLVEMCPDEPSRDRFLTRDFLAPRFFPWLVREYTDALSRRDRGAIRLACDNLEYAAALHKPKVRRMMKLLLPLMRQGTLASACLPLVRASRPVMRRLFR